MHGQESDAWGDVLLDAAQFSTLCISPDLTSQSANVDAISNFCRCAHLFEPFKASLTFAHTHSLSAGEVALVDPAVQQMEADTYFFCRWLSDRARGVKCLHLTASCLLCRLSDQPCQCGCYAAVVVNDLLPMLLGTLRPVKTTFQLKLSVSGEQIMVWTPCFREHFA